MLSYININSFSPLNDLPYNVLCFGLYWHLKIYDHFHHLLKYVLNTRLYLEREKKQL